MNIISPEIASALAGKNATDADISLLKRSFAAGFIPEWLLNMLKEFNLGAASLTLSEANDLSGLGAELKWLMPEQIVSEAFESEPGMTVTPIGFLPIAACAIGSGDPYFLDLRNSASVDPPLVRVLHEFGGEEEAKVLANGIEIITRRLSDFFANATVNPISNYESGLPPSSVGRS